MTWVRLCLKSTLLFFMFACAFIPSAAAAEKKARVLILYEESTKFGSNYPFPEAIEGLLGHYNSQISVEKARLNSIMPSQIKKYDIIFYLGTRDKKIPEDLLQSIATAKKTIWFDKNIEQLISMKGWKDTIINGEKSDLPYINYGSKNFSISNFIANRIIIPNGNSRIYAYASDDKSKLPYIWNRDNIWYFSSLQADNPYNIITCDVLHEILKINHPSQRKVLIRIEDVSPNSDPQKLLAITTFLTNAGYPFAIGVIPALSDKSGAIITINEKPALITILKAAQTNGASIIQHGYTHQNIYSPKTGEGYEFWNGLEDKPLPPELEQQTEARIISGLNILVNAGLYPVAFEAPHYAMSRTGYVMLAQHYSRLCGAIQLSDYSNQISFSYPQSFYCIYAKMDVWPETLGYYQADLPYSVEDILKEADKASIVRDCNTSFFFHCYMPVQKLKQITKGLIKQGYSFQDLTALPYTTQADGILIKSDGITQTNEIDLQKVAQAPGIQTRRDFTQSMWWLLTALISIVALLTIIAILSSRKRRFLYEHKHDNKRSETYDKPD